MTALLELARNCGAEEFYNEPHKLAVNARVLEAFAAALSAAHPVAQEAIADALGLADGSSMRDALIAIEDLKAAVHDAGEAALAAPCCNTAPLGAQGVEQRYCNKCGYFGPFQLHPRPNGGGQCDYLSVLATPQPPVSVEVSDETIVELWKSIPFQPGKPFSDEIVRFARAILALAGGEGKA